MKLFEIIQIPQIPKRVKAPNSETHNPVGSGHFADVYDDPDNPHQVIKHDRRVDDAYDDYIAMLSKSDRMARNPYFPRVYSRNDANGRSVVELEKLFPVDSLNSAEIEHIVNKAFGSVDNMYKYTGQLRKKHKNRGEPKNASEKKRDKDTHLEMFSNIIQKILMKGTPSTNILDKHLSQALMMLGTLSKNTSHFYDVSPNNMMVRRGPTGAQLVFTDPVASDEEYGGYEEYGDYKYKEW